MKRSGNYSGEPLPDDQFLVLLNDHAGRYVRWIRRYIRSANYSIDSTDDVKDVMQDVRIKCWTMRHHYDPSRPFTPWFISVLKSSMIDWSRRLKNVPCQAYPEEEFFHRPVSHHHGHSASLIADVITRQKIRQAIAQLPSNQAKIIWMKYHDGMGMTDIAQKIGLQRTEAYRCYWEAIASLKVILSSEHIYEGEPSSHAVMSA